MGLRKMWWKIFRTRYSALLETEVARLRSENRALLNSILGIAGVPPIAAGADDLPGEAALRAGSGAQTAKKSTAPRDTGGRTNAQNMTAVAAPTRRRSWHQVYRMLEIDSARKKEMV